MFSQVTHHPQTVVDNRAVVALHDSSDEGKIWFGGQFACEVRRNSPGGWMRSIAAIAEEFVKMDSEL